MSGRRCSLQSGAHRGPTVSQEMEMHVPWCWRGARMWRSRRRNGGMAADGGVLEGGGGRQGVRRRSRAGGLRCTGRMRERQQGRAKEGRRVKARAERSAGRGSQRWRGVPPIRSGCAAVSIRPCSTSLPCRYLAVERCPQMHAAMKQVWPCVSGDPGSQPASSTKSARRHARHSKPRQTAIHSEQGGRGEGACLVAHSARPPAGRPRRLARAGSGRVDSAAPPRPAAAPPGGGPQRDARSARGCSSSATRRRPI